MPLPMPTQPWWKRDVCIADEDNTSWCQQHMTPTRVSTMANEFAVEGDAVTCFCDADHYGACASSRSRFVRPPTLV